MKRKFLRGVFSGSAGHFPVFKKVRPFPMQGEEPRFSAESLPLHGFGLAVEPAVAKIDDEIG